MKSNIAARIAALENNAATASTGYYVFCWSSQEPGEAERRWREDREREGYPIPPDAPVEFVVWKDLDGSRAHDWSGVETPAWQRRTAG